jgi:hypothetical protein
MKFCYYNANPLGRKVNDCTVRAIALATQKSWDEAYDCLSLYAKAQGIMMDEVEYIDEYLEKNFKKLCGCKNQVKVTVAQFVETHPQGTYLITMNGHITCCVDGCVYDTFNPEDRIIWGVYEV